MSAPHTQFEDTCDITGIDNDVTVTGEVLQFREHEFITAMIDRSARVSLRWTDRAHVYVGTFGGVEFESPGPKAITGPKRLGGAR